MLGSISPEMFDGWLAYDKIVGDPLGRIATILKRGFASIHSSWGGEYSPDDFDPEPPEEGEAAVDEIMSPEQGANYARAHMENR